MSSAHRLSLDEESDSTGRSSPILSVDSSSALILVNDEDDSTPFDFSTEDEEFDPINNIGGTHSEPISPSNIFLYLLAPYLKLGAILLPNTSLPLKLGLPTLLLFAGLSAFVRQIWYNISRYLRKSELEEVLVEVFTKSGPRANKTRNFVRYIVRYGTTILRILLASVFLRESAQAFLPLVSDSLGKYAIVVLTLLLAFLLLPFCCLQSLSSRAVIYITWGSVGTYVVWLAFISYAHAHGTLHSDPGYLRLGKLWQAITTTAFVFTSTSTLSLYASLRESAPPITTAKSSTSRSFRILSILSVLVAVILTLPPVFFTAFPTAPFVHNIADPSTRVEPLIKSLDAMTLLFGIPSILVSSPSLPLPRIIRRTTSLPVSRILTWVVVILVSFIPSEIFSILNNVVLISALASTYFLPAVVHVTAHFVRRPVSIIIPTRAPTASTGADSPLPELLQRKERLLQRKQMHRRIIWDIGVWFLLIPVGCGGIVWTVGAIAGKW